MLDPNWTPDAGYCHAYGLLERIKTMASNLPPGVTESMIPGNRPEDVEYERFHEHVEQMLITSIGYERTKHFFDYIEKEDWEEVLREYVDIACGLAGAKAIMEMNIELELRKTDEADDS